MSRPRLTNRSLPIAAKYQLRQDPTVKLEQGDTLVEMLVAIVVVGLTVVAVLGALLTSTSASVIHRNSTSFEANLASFAEAARNSLEFQAYDGSGTGPSYVACATGYQLVGNPLPASGPPGSTVDVLGTGFTPTGGSNGTFPNATFNGSSAGFAVNAINSGPTGDIGQFTVPTNLTAGTYQITPFDRTHAAASTFTVTPWVGAMAPFNSLLGAGSKVIVSSAKWFAANTFLTVTIGSTSITNVVKTGATGTASNFTFMIPALLTGAQTVTVSDGSNTSPPQLLLLGNDEAPQDPLANPQTFGSFATFTSTISYWNNGWTTSPLNCTGTGYNPNIQQLGLSLIDNEPGNGSGAIQSLIVGNFGPQGLATPPVTLTATAQPNVTGVINLSWFAPTYQGSSAIMGYNVYCSTTAGTQGAKVNPTLITTLAYTDTTCNGSPLANGTTYYYEVTAASTLGESQPSNQATTSTVPGAPTITTATPGNGQVQLIWNAPSPNGNAPITGYNVYRSTTSGSETLLTNLGNVTTYTDSSVTNGTTYYYKVTAVNGGGESPFSNEVTVTPRTVAGPPQNLAVTPGSGQNALTWTAPVSNGGAAITGYNVYCSTTAGTQGAKVNPTLITTLAYTDTTCNGTPLANGTTYYYEVTAVNVAGEGSPSAQVNAIPGTCSAPTSFTAVSTGTKKSPVVTLQWSAPTTTNGSAVVTYNIYRSTTTTRPATPLTNVSAPGTYPATYADSSVAHGTTYYYWVTAVNGNGEGAAAMAGPVKP